MDWKKLKNRIVYEGQKFGNNAKNFYLAHEKECVIAGTVVLPLSVKIVQSISKACIAKTEERHKLLVDYDRSTGWYNQLKHPLSVQEKAMLLELKESQGITMTEALIKMNLLK